MSLELDGCSAPVHMDWFRLLCSIQDITASSLDSYTVNKVRPPKTPPLEG